MNRRDFVQGAGLVAATFAAPSAHTVFAEVDPLVDVDIALVDRSLPGSAAFAHAARARGIPAFEFASDVAHVWMRELLPRLRNGPVVIAGHTSAATLFCLDLLARDFGARTVRHVDAGQAMTFVISQHLGRRAALAPASVRAQWSSSHA